MSATKVGFLGIYRNYFGNNFIKKISVPTGVVTFERRSVPSLSWQNWLECEHILSDVKLHLANGDTIETDGAGLLQVDFANK